MKAFKFLGYVLFSALSYPQTTSAAEALVSASADWSSFSAHVVSLTPGAPTPAFSLMPGQTSTDITALNKTTAQESNFGWVTPIHIVNEGGSATVSSTLLDIQLFSTPPSPGTQSRVDLSRFATFELGPMAQVTFTVDAAVSILAGFPSGAQAVANVSGRCDICGSTSSLFYLSSNLPQTQSGTLTLTGINNSDQTIFSRVGYEMLALAYVPAVPEPSFAAMMLAGFVTIALVMRNRARS